MKYMEVMVLKRIVKKSIIWLLLFALIISSFPMGEGVKAETNQKEETEQSKETSVSEKSTVKEESPIELEAPTAEEDYLPVENIPGKHVNVSEGGQPGTYELTAYDDAVKIETKDGAVVPIDSTLRATENGYTTKATNLPVNFESAVQEDKPFLRVGEEKKDVTFTLKGLKYGEEMVAPTPTPATVRENQVWHKGVFPHVDLRHIALNDEVKEDLIIHQPSAVPTEIIYTFETALKPVLKGNEIIFYENDKEVMTMPVPEMQDSAIDEKSGLPARSQDLTYQLDTLEGSNYQLTVKPDQEWLQDPARKYPLYIDPTLARDATLDTFVSSKNPTSNMDKFWSASRGEYVLWIGYYDGTTGTNYGLIKFPALSDLRGATVSSANISSYVVWSYYATQANGLWLDRVNENWSETGVTWNTRPASTNLLSTNVARNQWANFDVSTFVSQVANGTRTDYGFKFHTNGNSTSHWKQITASETNKNRTRLNVTYSYPKLATVTTEGFLTTPTSSTGHVNVTWPAMAGATGYRLQMFDGKGWQTVYSGANRSFTTKDKGLFPKTSQYATLDTTTGGIKFRNGDGQELPVDPSDFFNKSSKTTTNTLSYQFRVIADYKLGSGSASSVAKRSLQELIPDVPTGLSLSIGNTTTDDKAQFVLEWDESDFATSYDVYAFNGFAYELIDNVKEASWSPNGKRLFPTTSQIDSMPINTRTAFRKGDGQDFPGDPRPLYRKNNPDRTTYHNVLHYYFRVYAKSAKGQSAGSEVRTFNVPTPNVTAVSNGYIESQKNQTGYLFANWQPVSGAAGYNVYLFNGKEYDLVESLSDDVISWSSRNKKLWPLEGQSYKLNNGGVVGEGGELPVDPSPNYRLSSGKYSDYKNYWIRITAFRRKMKTGVLEPTNFISEGDLTRTLPATPSIEKNNEQSLGTESFYPMVETPIGSFNALNNNQLLEETDMTLPGRGPEVVAKRYFNSKNTELGMFGFGWNSEYERRLEIPRGSASNLVRYIDADRSVHFFSKTIVTEYDEESGEEKTREKLLPLTGTDYEFDVETQNNQYVIQSLDGQRETYDHMGRLISIEERINEKPTTNKVKFDYNDVNNPQRLTTVYAASDGGDLYPNRINYIYDENGLVKEMKVTVSSDAKKGVRTYHYKYDEWDRLSEVESFADDIMLSRYVYKYIEKVSSTSDSGEIPSRPKNPSPISVIQLPGHQLNDPYEIVAEYENEILSTVINKEGIKTTYAKDTDSEQGDVDITLTEKNSTTVYSFDASGYLKSETYNDKVTLYKWEDNRIVETKNVDNSIDTIKYTERKRADFGETENQSQSEHGGLITEEKGQMSAIQYEYSNNNQVIRTEDELGLTEENLIDKNQEVVGSHEISEERIDFYETDANGNVIRSGIGVTPGVNYYPNGSFETQETVDNGVFVEGGKNGRALRLESETFTKEIKVTPGAPYTFAVDMKTLNEGKGSATLIFIDDNNIQVAEPITIRPVKNLKEFTRRIVEMKAPETAKRVRINLISESGVTFFDEAQLDSAQSGNAVSASAFNHVEQSGFEQVDRWKLDQAVKQSTGYMSEYGLMIQPGGSASQTIFVNQNTAKPFYVSALAQKATKDDFIKVKATFEDGSILEEKRHFADLDYNESKNETAWQRQSIQTTSDSKKLVKIELTIYNGSSSDFIVDAVRASVGRVVANTTYGKETTWYQNQG